jgi:hypothetical protein
VLFIFKQKNHTVTQSTFDSPCQRIVSGFDSGLSVLPCDVKRSLTDKACSIPVPAENVDGPFPRAQFTVRDTQPVWVYCRQANHCQQGMVFGLNPGDQFPAFKAKAMASGSPPASTSPAVSSSPPPPLPTSTSTPVVVNPCLLPLPPLAAITVLSSEVLVVSYSTPALLLLNRETPSPSSSVRRTIPLLSPPSTTLVSLWSAVLILDSKFPSSRMGAF